MNKKETNIIINGVKKDVNPWLTTLKTNPKNPEEMVVFIPVDGYDGLGGMIKELIGVCRTALHTINDNHNNFSDFDMYNYYGANSQSVANVLKYVIDILPLSELELLENIRTNSVD